MKSRPFILLMIIVGMGSCKQNLESEFADAETVNLSDDFSEESPYKGLTAELKSIGIIRLEGQIMGRDSLVLDRTLLTASGRISEERVKELEKCKLVIKRPNKIRINVDGIEIYVKNKKIVGVGKLDVSQETLLAITEAYAFLDQLRYMFCSDLRSQYLVEPINMEMIKYLIDKRQEAIMKLLALNALLKSNVNKQNVDDEIRKGIEGIVEG